MKTKILTLTIAALLPATWAFAQGDGGPRPPGGPRDGDRPKGEGSRDGQRPPGPMPMALVAVIDADGDGIISADEMKNAPAALKKLDKNNDGSLSREELQARPPGGGGPRERRGGDEGKAKAGPRDGERPPGGPRDGDRPQGGPRDGERPRGGPREGEGKAPEGGREKPPGGERGQGERPPAPPLVGALDADHDGSISAQEIDNAAEALAKLDQNKDGQLGPKEYGPRPPEGGRPPREGGPGAKGGDKPAE